jgi:hypothetical protein
MLYYIYLYVTASAHFLPLGLLDTIILITTFSDPYRTILHRVVIVNIQLLCRLFLDFIYTGFSLDISGL